MSDNDLILYNEEPMLEVGSWRVLCPNAYGKKYKGKKDPMLIHKCPKHNPDEFRFRTIYGDMKHIHPKGNPRCFRCQDPVPDEIQGIMAMYHWNKGCDGG